MSIFVYAHLFRNFFFSLTSTEAVCPHTLLSLPFVRIKETPTSPCPWFCSSLLFYFMFLCILNLWDPPFFFDLDLTPAPFFSHWRELRINHSADHFQEMLKQHPPQTSSRASLSNWACSVHNIVNIRLGKPEFDCSTLADVYKCGCADEPIAEEDGVSPADAAAGGLAEGIDALAALTLVQQDRDTIVDTVESELEEAQRWSLFGGILKSWYIKV